MPPSLPAPRYGSRPPPVTSWRLGCTDRSYRERLPLKDLPGPLTFQTAKDGPGDDAIGRDKCDKSTTRLSRTIRLSGERQERETPPRSLPSRGISLLKANVSLFVSASVRSVPGASVGASVLYAAYHSWCRSNGHEPVSAQKFGAELRNLGFTKWKTNGRIRYRDRQLVG